MHVFDAIVVGSGFGGSVMTYELARAGMRVCLLERGKAYAPGEFARSPHQMRLNTWDPSAGLHGMFNIWHFKNLDVIVSSGLGGGSLVYANVLLRKPRAWFESESWPIGYDELDKHYATVERLLGGQKFPARTEPYSNLHRARAFRQAIERAADNMGSELVWEDLSLSISFANSAGVAAPGRLLDDGTQNLHKRPRVTCQLCGECDIGCNHGSKNSLDYTCLSLADTLGATILRRSEVRSFQPIERDDSIIGYKVDYVDHSTMVEGRPREEDPLNQPEPRTIYGRQLILAAGTLGTTFLMLRNQKQFPELSKQLGSRFSGNGDLLGFAVRRRTGWHDQHGLPSVDPSYGPVITSCAGFPKGIPSAAGGRSGRGFFIEDAGFPHALNWALRLTPGNLIKAGVAHSPELARSMLNSILRTIAKYTPAPVRRPIEQLIERDSPDIGLSVANIMRLLSQEEMIPLLGMGQDTPDGRIRLDDDGRLAEVDWERRGSQDYYDDLRLAMRKIADAMGADFINSMSWPLRRAITVHPLGGCPIGRTADEGVVDLYGEVFRGERRYDGLFIADGSVMPGPVGANPSLTIAALAHRFAGKVIQNHRGRGRGSS